MLQTRLNGNRSRKKATDNPYLATAWILKSMKGVDEGPDVVIGKLLAKPFSKSLQGRVMVRVLSRPMILAAIHLCRTVVEIYTRTDSITWDCQIHRNRNDGKFDSIIVANMFKQRPAYIQDISKVERIQEFPLPIYREDVQWKTHEAYLWVNKGWRT